MPQLLPFTFVNQLSFGYLTIIILLYYLSIYLLPRILLINNIRIFITLL